MDNIIIDLLENKLGDANDPSQLFSFKQRVAEDDAQNYPTAAIKLLNDFGLQHYYVPHYLGGKLCSIEQLGGLLRVVSQRDLTVAISHAITFLGCAAIWITGRQQQLLADAILSGEMIAMGLTEEGAGSDLLNMKTKATRQDDHYYLKGHKWLVNGANHNRFVIIYAQSNEQNNARGYSLYLYDKNKYPNGFKALPKITTLGIRGADISAISIDTNINEDALIGQEGAGFEIMLKALQLSRTLCGSLSLGVLDTGLDNTLNFILDRPIYGKTVANITQSQKLVCEAWAQYLICESLNEVVKRGLQAIPEQACIHSSVLKYFIPTLAEQTMQKLSVIYGARYYLREGHESGIFQKMLRDNLLVSLFDGSTQVNLHSLSFQLSGIARQHKPELLPQWIERDMALNDFDFENLTLHSGGHDDLFASLPTSISILKNKIVRMQSLQNEITTINEALNAIEASYKKLLQDLLHLSPNQYISGDPWVFELAQRYCILSASAAVLAQYHLNRTLLESSLAAPAVLALVLQRIAHLLGHNIFLPTTCYQAVFSHLIMRREIDRKYYLFSTAMPIKHS